MEKIPGRIQVYHKKCGEAKKFLICGGENSPVTSPPPKKRKPRYLKPEMLMALTNNKFSSHIFFAGTPFINFHGKTPFATGQT